MHLRCVVLPVPGRPVLPKKPAITSDDPPAKTTCFSPLTNAPTATGRLQQLASVAPHRARYRAFRFSPSSFSFFPPFFLLLFTCFRVRPQGFDGPRGEFPGRRGSTEGASHTRLGHEPRPSDLLKISIALVRRSSRPSS